MPKPSPSATTPQPIPHEYDPLAGFLSYLVPGLGQIYQGRIGKGVVFLVCLLGLFIFGMALGNWKNVYLPDSTSDQQGGRLPTATLSLLGRNIELDNGLRKALYYRLQYMGQFWIGVAAWPALWQYLSYDPGKDGSGFLRNFERAPTEAENNDNDRSLGKKLDLSWVYTVIAGVLNILVIYDAFAGPVFVLANEPDGLSKEANPA